MSNVRRPRQSFIAAVASATLALRWSPLPAEGRRMRKPATRKHWAGAPSSVLVVVLLVVFTSCRGAPSNQRPGPT